MIAVNFKDCMICTIIIFIIAILTYPFSILNIRHFIFLTVKIVEYSYIHTSVKQNLKFRKFGHTSSF